MSRFRTLSFVSAVCAAIVSLFVSMVAQAQFTNWAFLTNTPYLVQSCHTGAAGASTTITCTLSATRAGDLFVFIAGWSVSSATPISSASDDKGNTCTVNVNAIQGGNSVGSAYCPIVTAASTVFTVTFASSGSNRFVFGAVYRNAGAIDKHAAQSQNNPGTGTDAVSSTAVTPTVNGELLVGFMIGLGAGVGTISAGTGYALDLTVADIGQGAVEHLVQATAASKAATFTITSSNSSLFTDTYILTFNPKG